MLKQLEISNYAIIEKVSVPFDKGFTVITGETGAGKSIILGALGLILGKRADSSVLNNPEKKSIVEATFDIRDYDMQGLFENEDIDFEETTIIRREITPSGKSRAFINDTPVNLSTLKTLTDRLVNLHQQFDLLDIQKKSFQLDMLDAFAEVQPDLVEYRVDFSSLAKKKKHLEALKAKSIELSKESDFLKFQLEELNTLPLEDINQEEIESELNVLNNAEGIINSGNQASYAINDNENAIVDQLRTMAKDLSQYGAVDKAMESLNSRLDENIEILNDWANDIKDYVEQIDGDGNRAAELQDTLNELYRLQKKHHINNTEELLAFRDEVRAKLKTSSTVDKEIVSTEKEIKKLEANAFAKAKKISKKRAQSSTEYQDRISGLLSELGMPQAKLIVKQEIQKELNKSGIDDIEYYFAPNLGSVPKPVKDTASGGEISRLTLCLKSVVASVINLPTMIFDEIDTGVSGEVSIKMGNIMREMAQGKQVVSITHSAQIASRADDHLFIYKQVVDKKTKTQIRSLTDEERVLEIAKILSGDPPSQSAITNAQELIKM